ncbi:MAG: Glyoxalase/bleomycin resistance protein/dioxygenase [Acidobacteria bacterium]|nr:Glyoxalase/bleomycin resistance protein/dioxygenase [Acidobacteriota bacterium]
MAEFTSHAPGIFSWPELATTDQQAAVAFYRGLFGWDVNEQPIGPTEVYSMFQMRGKPVAAAATQQAPERQMGVPPHWNAYVTVASVEESATKAESLGGTVLMPPLDVMDAGRMAVVQDPTGAVFQLWQANRSIGAEILNEPGALCWTELNTRDTKKAEAFYTGLFGWGVKHAAPSSAMEYTEFSVDGQPAIGMIPMNEHMPAGVPSYWMPYFQVANTDASAEKIAELGGSIMVPAQDIPGTGRFAIGRDPQGAMFAVFQYTEKS